jgi:hypothetical protein
LLGEDVAPVGGDDVEYVNWVNGGLVVVIDSSETGGMFVFEVSVAFVFVLLEVVFPVVDTIVFLLLFEMVLCGKESVNDGLALCRTGGCGRNVVDFGGEYFPKGGNGIDVGLGDFVVWHFNFGVEEFELSELVDGVVNGVGWVATIVGVGVGRSGPRFPFEVGGGKGVEVFLSRKRKKRPGVFGILIVKRVVEVEVNVVKLVSSIGWLFGDVGERKRFRWKIVRNAGCVR